MSTFDAIVLGTGGVGSAAVYHLARRGARVLGLDPFGPAHDRGSSHGQTRAIRQAYFEHPDYVPLLLAAYDLWRELEQQGGQQLYFDVGLLEVGPPDGLVIPGVLRSAQQHNLAIEQFGADEVQQRFPGFVMPEGAAAVFERDAGYLLVEECVRAHWEAAGRHGAKLAPLSVRSWCADGNSVRVETESGTYEAGQLIICTGAWSVPMLRQCGVALRVLRKHLHWYADCGATYRQSAGCPVFFFETTDGFFYGFPKLDHRGVKVGEHSGGETVTDPSHLAREVDPTDRRRVEAFLESHLPGVTRNAKEHAVCMYTMSPDDHFVVDRHPHHKNVFIAAGLSGHGFKFTSVLGLVLAELALDGKSSLPIDFLSMDRASLQGEAT